MKNPMPGFYRILIGCLVAYLVLTACNQASPGVYAPTPTPTNNPGLQVTVVKETPPPTEVPTPTPNPAQSSNPWDHFRTFKLLVNGQEYPNNTVMTLKVGTKLTFTAEWDGTGLPAGWSVEIEGWSDATLVTCISGVTTCLVSCKNGEPTCEVTITPQQKSVPNREYIAFAHDNAGNGRASNYYWITWV
jgi:hypothetical protein